MSLGASDLHAQSVTPVHMEVMPSPNVTVTFITCNYIVDVSFKLNGVAVSSNWGGVVSESCGSPSDKYLIPITLSPGRNVFSVDGCTPDYSWCGTQSYDYYLGGLTLDIGTASATRTTAPNAVDSVKFTVTPNRTTYPYDLPIVLSPYCEMPVWGCSFSPSAIEGSTQLSQSYGAPQTVTMYYRTTAQTGTGRVIMNGWYQTWGANIRDSVHVNVAVGTTPRPLVLAHDTTVTVQPNSSIAQVFRIRANGGAGSATYNLSASCGSWTSGGCAPGSSSVTLTAGQEVTMGVHYVSGPPVSGAEPTPTPIRLIATLAGVASDTGTAHTKLADVLTPTATIVAPGQDTTVRASVGGGASIPLRVEWCDPDGTLTGPYVYLNGTALSLSIQSITRAGCRTARAVEWSSLALPVGTNTIRTHVYDLEMHLVETTRTVTVMPPQPPIVTILTPSQDTVLGPSSSNPGYTGARTRIVVEWCDPDGPIASRVVRTASWAQPLPDNFTPITKAGCAAAGTSIYEDASIWVWGQQLVATATDDQGLSGSATRNITYALPLAELQPLVTPKDQSVQVSGGASSNLAYWVKNNGRYGVQYSLIADCVGLLNCTVPMGAVTIAVGDSTPVQLSFTAPASTPAGGLTARLIARFDAAPYVPAGTYASTIVADTGSVAVLLTPPRPVVLAHDTTVTVQPNSAVAQVFRIRAEGGSGSATYQLSASCGAWTSGGCGPGSSSVTLTAGQEVTMGVHYVSGPPVSGPSTPTPIRLIATLVGVVADTGTAHTRLADVLPPVVTFVVPGRDTVVAASTLPVRVEWCDPDGNLEGVRLYHGSTDLGASPQVISRPTCATAYEYMGSVQLVPWDQSLSLLGWDTASHSTTVTRAVTYAPVAQVKPIITATQSQFIFPETPGYEARARFRIQNPGPVAVPYRLSFECGGELPCATSASITIPAGGVDSVDVGFPVPGVPITTPVTVKLRAQFHVSDVSSASLALFPITSVIDSAVTQVRTKPVYAAGIAATTTFSRETRAGATGKLEYTVRNDGMNAGIVDVQAICDAAFTSCVRGATGFSLAPGATRTDTATYQLATDAIVGSLPRIRVLASMQQGGAVARDSAAITVLTREPTIAFTLRPDPTHVAYSAGVQSWAPFALTNLGSDTTTFRLSAIVTAGFTVPLFNGDTVRVAPGQTVAAKALVTGTGAVGTIATLTMTATHLSVSGVVHNRSAQQELRIAGPTTTLSVTPKGTGASFPAAGGTFKYAFDVTHNGTTDGKAVDLVGSCPTGFTDCQIVGAGALTQRIWMLPGERRTVQLQFTTTQYGRITLQAKLVDAPTTSDYAQADLYPGGSGRGVAVTPDAGTLNPALGLSTAFPFAIRNTGIVSAAYQWSLNCTGQAACPTGVSGTTGVLEPGAVEYVDVHFTAPGVVGGTGTLRLVASDLAEPTKADTGVVTVNAQVPPVFRQVALDGGMSGEHWVSSGYLTNLTVINQGNAPDQIDYTVTCSGALTCAQVSRRSPVLSQYTGNWTDTVTITTSATPGAVGYVTYWARSVGDQSKIATKTTTVTLRDNTPVTLIAITPKSQSHGDQEPGSLRTFQFVIQNTGNTPSGISWNLACVAPLTCPTDTQLNAETGAIAAGGSVSVAGYYTTPPAGQTGTLRLIATRMNGSTIDKYIDTATVTVRGMPGTGVGIVQGGINAGRNISRDECLTIAAGDDAAYECGDLRVVHALPATTTMNKTRAPTLIYNSAHAMGRIILHADVAYTPQAGDLPVDAIQLAVKRTLNGPAFATKTFAWNAAWSDGKHRRLAIEILNDSLGETSSSYVNYVLQVRVLAGEAAVKTDNVNGSFALVDRRHSPYGRGWWIDGLEQLRLYGADSVLWVGGDGSTRLYQRVAATERFMADTLDRVDSLTRNPSTGEYSRWLRNRARVEFDGTGYHIRTINARQDTTIFAHDTVGGGVKALRTITLPVPSTGPAAVYTLGYTVIAGRPRLTTVDAPDVTSGGVTAQRIVQLSYETPVGPAPEGHLQRITDVDSTYVSFGYVGDRVTRRTNRRQHDWNYVYDSDARTLTSASIADASIATGTIQTTFCAVEGASLSACAPAGILSDSASTLVDGPRSDVADITRFWVNRWGAPTTIRNALGQLTTIERTDTRFPQLATAVTTPGGLRTEGTYTTRGLIDSSIVVDPLGQGCGTRACAAITTYQWDSVWDKPVTIAPPLVGATTMQYEASTGDLQWAEQAGDRTSYRYAANRQVRAIQSSNGAVDSLGYDALGNLTYSRSPLGYVSDIERDDIGRPFSTTTPLDTTANARVLTQRTYYDRMGRDTLTVTGAPNDPQVHVRQLFDAEGNLLQVARRKAVLEPGDDTSHVIRYFVYDAAGRRIEEGNPNSDIVSYQLDAAGNDTSGGRTIHSVRRRYDALNRLVSRTSGSDTSTYTYHVNGAIETASNAIAQVTRTYYPNGLLKSETQALREPANPSANPESFLLEYAYDLAGRRTSMTHPAQSPGTTSYQYHSTSGLLQLITDPRQNLFRFGYDGMGRLQTVVRREGTAGEVTETRGYDLQSRLRTRVQTLAGGTLLHDDVLHRDARDKVLHQAPNGDNITYDLLGRVESAHWYTSNSNETLTHDPVGRLIRSATRSGHPPDRVEELLYRQGTEQLSAKVVRENVMLMDSTAYEYDFAGNQRVSIQVVQPLDLNGFPLFSRVRQTTMGYDADNRLSSTTFSYDSLDTSGIPKMLTYHRSSSYRYDALGRRVWHRTDYEAARCDAIERETGCLSGVTRVIWDGDQILYEDRGGGAPITYTHGTGIDEPLAVYRGTSESLVPLTNWRGIFDRGICENTVCTSDQVWFPGGTASSYRFGLLLPRPWWGSLIEGQIDPSGLMYRRNRYYDPATGQFTQVDPIGIAGGLNVYGFAEGDPVNYSDPFGLKVTPTTRAMERTLRAMRASPTFNRLFMALDSRPARRVNHFVAEGTSTEVLSFSANQSGAGHTVVLFGSGRSMVNSELGISERVVAHELIHAAASYSAVSPEDSGVPRGCSDHRTWSSACSAIEDRIVAELRAQREQQRQRDAKKSEGREP